MAKWEDFSVSKEFKLWYNLKEICLLYEINESKLIDYHDLTDFWEPLFEKVFRLGLQYKQTAKLKEIKIEWMRPMFFTGIEDKLVIDGKCWTTEAEREALNKAQELKRNFSYLVTAILDYDKVDSSNFKKQKKNLQDCSKGFFKNLIIFVTKKLYDQLKIILKSVLRPLLDLRKANYHLFMLEKREEGDMELTFFNDKKDLRAFTDTISQWFREEEVKLKRDCDMDAFEDFLNKNNNKSYYQYSFTGKGRDGFNNKENTKTRKEILQKKFVAGITSFLNYLYVKKPEDFYQEIDVHKLFKNLGVPKANELKPLKFYGTQMHLLLKEFKEKLWEMKLNGSCRIKMPITANTELIELTKKIFDLHILIDKIIGDRLKWEQYIFIYNSITFIVDSSIKEEITIFKDKNFMEDVLPKYLIFCAIKNCVNILAKMKAKAKAKGEVFDINNFFQPQKYQLDSESNELINAWYYTDSMKKQSASNPEAEETKKALFAEIDEFGSRFWPLEGLFDLADRNLWFEGINILKDVNALVQDDIRDFILINYEHFKNPNEPNKDYKKKVSRNDSLNVSTNKMTSLKNLRKEPTNRTTSTKGKKPSVPARRGIQQQEKPEKSFDSEDESVIARAKVNNLINIETLRPPNVWNFPIDLVKKKSKEEEKKNEIRIVDPRNFYKDGRVKNFLEILNNIKNRMLQFSAEKKEDNWKYYFDCVLKIHGIMYSFHQEKKKDDNLNETVILSDS